MIGMIFSVSVPICLMVLVCTTAEDDEWEY